VQKSAIHGISKVEKYNVAVLYATTMKKKAKKQSDRGKPGNKSVPTGTGFGIRENASERLLLQYDKKSILAITAAAAVFFAVLFWLHTTGLLSGPGDITAVEDAETVEFEKGTVVEVISEDLEADEAADGAYMGAQELSVVIKSGRYKGEVMTANTYFGPLSGVPVAKGDSVTLTIRTHTDGTHSAAVYEFNRIPILAAFVILFFIVVMLVGGRTGMKSLLGLVFTVICLFFILIPLLLAGAPTILTTFLVCAYIAFVSFTILGGVHRKTMSAFLGTAAGAFFAMVFGIVVQFFARIDGLRLEDAEPLFQLRHAGAVVGLGGCLQQALLSVRLALSWTSL
jgi:uncharacterized membrane protein